MKKRKILNRIFSSITLAIYLFVIGVFVFAPTESSEVHAELNNALRNYAFYPDINFNCISRRLPGVEDNPRVVTPLATARVGSDLINGRSLFYEPSYWVGDEQFSSYVFELYEKTDNDHLYTRNIEYSAQHSIAGFTLLAESFVFNPDDGIVGNYTTGSEICLYSSYIGGNPIPFNLTMRWSYLTVLDGKLYAADTSTSSPIVCNDGVVTMVTIFSHLKKEGYSGAFLISDLQLSFDFNDSVTHQAIGITIPTFVFPMYYASQFVSIRNDFNSLLNPPAELNLFDSIVSSVNRLLQIELLPGLRIIHILLLALCVPLTVWLLKAWLGG